MNRWQIDKLASSYPNSRVVETHISWVILSQEHAFKIKKPVKLSFLDFSTLALRKKYCQIELRLNSRWSEIYQAVLPVLFDRGTYIIGGAKGKIRDYAVVMKRMDENARMDNLLATGRVTITHVTALAKTIAKIHNKSTVVKRRFSQKFAAGLFNDLYPFAYKARHLLPPKMLDVARKSTLWSDEFLKTHRRRFQDRIDAGFQRDVHGDLHSGNVFLSEKPVVFDCLEFNSRYRQIDILYEAAFLAMDLDSFGRGDLSKKFMSRYIRLTRCMTSAEDKSILLYFKCLRANVRAKVHLIRAVQANNQREVTNQVREASRYLKTVELYMNEGQNQVKN